MEIELTEKIGKADAAVSSRLTQKAYLNSVAHLLEYVTRVGVGLVVTPILVSGLGTVYFGVWQMLSRLVSHLPAASGRPAQALTLVVANRQSSDDLSQKKRDIGSALGVWAIFLPFFLIVGSIIVWFSPQITKISGEMSSTVRLTSALLVLNFLLAGLVFIPGAVLRGMNLGYKRMGFIAGATVVGGILTAAAVYLGLGMAGIAGSQIIVTVLTGGIFLLLVKKHVPWFGFIKPSIKEIKNFFKLSGWYTLWTFVNKILMVSDVVILGIFSSASAVTLYALTGYASQLIISIISFIVQGALPGLGGLIGQKKFDKVADLRSEMLALNWLLITGMGATILLWNKSFIFLWVGSGNYAGVSVNLFIIIVIAQMVFIRNDSFIIDLTLNLRKKVILGAVAALISIIFSMMLIPRLGILGLCIALLTGRLLLSFYYPLFVSSFLKKSFRQDIRNIFRPVVTMGVIFLFAAYLSEHVEVTANWIKWGLYCTLSAIMFTAICFLIGLNSSQKSRLVTRFKNVQLIKY